MTINAFVVVVVIDEEIEAGEVPTLRRASLLVRKREGLRLVLSEELCG
jgi:hypothetical protein